MRRCKAPPRLAVAGNRYGWFMLITVNNVAIDDVRRNSQDLWIGVSRDLLITSDRGA